MPNSLRCKIKHLCHNGTITESERDRILKALEQEPCEDAISRQAVNRILDEISGDFSKPREAVVYVDLIADSIADLPSVNPQKIGHWIFDKERLGYWISKCSACGHLFHGNESLIYRPKYCANCGAKMVEPKESEVEA